MREEIHKPATDEELRREAKAWDRRVLTPEGWTDTPEAVPHSTASIAISLRIPAQMLTIVKEFARREGVGYQVLIKRWLDDRIREERNKMFS